MWGEVYALIVSAFIDCFLRGTLINAYCLFQAIMSSPTRPSWTSKWFVTDFQLLEQVTSGVSFFLVLQINYIYAVHTWLPEMQYK